MTGSDVTIEFIGLIVSIISNMVFSSIVIAFLVFTLAGKWKMFEKAGEPGWAIFVPFMSAYKLCKIAIGDGWFFLIFIIPIINFIMKIVLGIKLARVFGKGTLFGLGLAFLSGIFYMILGFGSATYQGQTNVINKI